MPGMIVRDRIQALIIGAVLATLSIYIGFAVNTFVLPHAPGFGWVILRPLCALAWALMWGLVLGAISLETNCGGAPNVQLHARGTLAFVSAFFLVLAGAYQGFAPVLGALWWPCVIILYAFFIYGFTHDTRPAVAG